MQVFYQIISVLCRTGVQQHIHMEFINTSLLLILSGFNTRVYIDFPWLLG